MTLDGFCDHTIIVPDDELLKHYDDLITKAGCILYGRITYQLMKDYWPAMVTNPTGNKQDDEFAVAIDNIPKIVFSRTLTDAGWKNARLAKGSLEEEVSELRKQPGRYILAGSRSMIITLMKLKLIDEYQFCVHPVVNGSGLALFEKINNRITLKLFKTKKFGSGAVILYYKPVKQ